LDDCKRSRIRPFLSTLRSVPSPNPAVFLSRTRCRL
jgi:hypothetical protein